MWFGASLISSLIFLPEDRRASQAAYPDRLENDQGLHLERRACDTAAIALLLVDLAHFAAKLIRAPMPRLAPHFPFQSSGYFRSSSAWARGKRLSVHDYRAEKG